MFCSGWLRESVVVNAWPLTYVTLILCLFMICSFFGNWLISYLTRSFLYFYQLDHPDNLFSCDLLVA